MRMTWKGVTTLTLSAMGMLCIGSVFAQSDITITSYDNDYTKTVLKEQVGFNAGGFFDLLGLEIKNTSSHAISLPTFTLFVDGTKGCPLEKDQYNNYFESLLYIYISKNGSDTAAMLNAKAEVIPGHAIIYTFDTPRIISAGQTEKIHIMGGLCSDKTGNLDGFYATDTSFDTIAKDDSYSNRIYGPIIKLGEKTVSQDDGSLDIDVKTLFFKNNESQAQLGLINGGLGIIHNDITNFVSPGLLGESMVQSYSQIGDSNPILNSRQIIIHKISSIENAKKLFTTNYYRCGSKDCFLLTTPDSDGNQRYCSLQKKPYTGKFRSVTCEVLYKNIWFVVSDFKSINTNSWNSGIEDFYEFLAKPILIKLYAANGATYKTQLTATENKLVASTQKSIDTASSNQKATLIAKLTAQLKTEKNARKKMVLEKILQKYK